MSRKCKNRVSQFIDIEARVEDGEDEEDEEDEMDSGASAPLTFLSPIHIKTSDGFIEDWLPEKAQYTPWKRRDLDSSSDHRWTELVSSLQKRYGPREPFENHPAMR